MLLVNLRNGFKCLPVNSSFLAGQLPVFRISCLSKSLCFLWRVQLLSLCGVLVDFQLVHLAENRTLDYPACVWPRLPRLTAEL